MLQELHSRYGFLKNFTPYHYQTQMSLANVQAADSMLTEFAD